MFSVDLDMDSNNDGTLARDQSEEYDEMTDPGAMFWRNLDDDNGNSQVDYLDPGPFRDINGQPVDDNNLVLANLSVLDGGAQLGGYVLDLVAGPQVRLWRTRDKEALSTHYVIGTDTLPTQFYVEGYEAGQTQIHWIMRNPTGTELVRDSVRVTVYDVDLIAHRPQTPHFQAVAVPWNEEENPGAGIRRNGDDDDADGTPDLRDPTVNGDNDLIQLDFNLPSAIAGARYVLSRSNANVSVWTSNNKGQALLSSGGQRDLPPGTTTGWAEWTSMDPGQTGCDLELSIWDTRHNRRIDTDRVHFYPFTSVVILLGGEFQYPTDPLPLEEGRLNLGTFQMAIDQYRSGYDVYMYNEDDVHWTQGYGAAYDEVVNAIQNRGVASVGIVGYSHGGGAVYQLSYRLWRNTQPNDLRDITRPFNLDFTAYIDAVTQSLMGAEERRPLLTRHHVNYWQEHDYAIGGRTSGENEGFNVTPRIWGTELTHTTIEGLGRRSQSGQG